MTGQFRRRAARWLVGAVTVGAALLGAPAGAHADPGAPAGYAARWVSYCNYGGYTAYAHIKPTYAADGSSSPELWSYLLSSGQCWGVNWSTRGKTAQVDIVLVRGNGSERWINAAWFNSNQSGVTIQSYGGESNPSMSYWAS